MLEIDWGVLLLLTCMSAEYNIRLLKIILINSI